MVFALAGDSTMTSLVPVTAPSPATAAPYIRRPRPVAEGTGQRKGAGSPDSPGCQRNGRHRPAGHTAVRRRAEQLDQPAQAARRGDPPAGATALGQRDRCDAEPGE